MFYLPYYYALVCEQCCKLSTSRVQTDSFYKKSNNSVKNFKHLIFYDAGQSSTGDGRICLFTGYGVHHFLIRKLRWPEH